MTSAGVRAALGGCVGLVALLAMVRLISGAFGAGSGFAWTFLLLAMIPWVGYVAWRARHGRLSRRAAALVASLCLVGVLAVWLFTFGPVVALAASLAAFGVIWVHDWPPRQRRGDAEFVRIEDLTDDAD